MNNSNNTGHGYKQSLMKYAEKYGVGRASHKYNKSRSYIYFWKKRLVRNVIQMDNAITVRQMISLLKLTKSAINRAIKDLKENNRISCEGATKNSKWIVLK